MSTANGETDTPEGDATYTLHRAVLDRGVLSVRFLINQGRPVNEQDGAGNTPLHLAAERDLISIVQAFKEARADPNITNAAGITPWQTAMLEGHTRVAKRLVEMGARRNHRYVDESCQLCGVHEGHQSVATDCEGAIRADRVRLTTIFEHWHPGKLVLFWVMCWVGALLSVNTGILIVDFAGETPVTISLALGAWFLATLLVVTPFVVTWRWFTAREKETDKPPDGTP